MPDRIIVSAPGPQGPAGSGGGGSISDGDKGDITVTGVGTVWTVDAGAINTTKLGGDITTAGKALLDDADAAAQRTTLGLGTAALEGAAYFATATHSHTAGDIGTFPTDSLVGRSAAGAGVCRDIAIGSGLTIDTGVEPPELKLTPSASQYVETTRTVTAGTGLTGGGDLGADRSFAVSYGTSAGTACEGDDARLSDARTPTAHTHALSDIQQGGALTGEVLKWNGSAWAPGTDNTSGGGGGAPTNAQYFTLTADATLSDERVLTFGTGLTATDGGAGAQYDVEVDYGTTAATACEGNDSRLSDARTPTAHTHALSDIQQGGASTGEVLKWNGSSWAPGTDNTGAGGATAVAEDEVAWHAITAHPRWEVVQIGSGTGVAAVDGTALLGVYRLNTGTQTSSNRRVSYMSKGHRLDLATSSEFVASCAMSTNHSGTDTGYATVGFIDEDAAGASDATDGAYFREIDGGNWFAVTRSNTTETATDTGTASGATFVRLRVLVEDVGGTLTAKFYVNGTLAATHTTNVPSGSGRDTGQGLKLVRASATSGDVALDVDYVYTKIVYSSSMDIT